jgi:hypothetical protein
MTAHVSPIPTQLPNGSTTTFMIQSIFRTSGLVWVVLIIAWMVARLTEWISVCLPVLDYWEIAIGPQVPQTGVLLMKPIFVLYPALKKYTSSKIDFLIFVASDGPTKDKGASGLDGLSTFRFKLHRSAENKASWKVSRKAATQTGFKL